VIPQLFVRAGWVISQIHRLEEASFDVSSLRFRAPTARIAEIGELARIPLAAERTLDTHQ